MRIPVASVARPVVAAMLLYSTAAPLHAQSPTTAGPGAVTRAAGAGASVGEDPTATPVTLRQGVGVDTLAIRAHTRFLADDLLRGRGAGTDGERLAAAYITSQLIRLGLEPAGQGGSFLQPIPLTAARIADDTRLVVSRGDSTLSYTSPRDFIVDAGGAASFRDFAGRVIFAGSPLEAGPALRAAPDLSNAVIAITGLPGAAAVSLIPEWIRRGVRGVFVLTPDAAYYDLIVNSRGEERLFIDAAVDDPVWQSALPKLVLGPALSGALLEAAGALHAARPEPGATIATAGSAIAALPLDWHVDVRIRTTRRDLRAANVAGIVRGSDSDLREEFVVYTAHYDHLGVGAPDPAGDSIYNGFSDNAAGVAMLLAIAERMKHAPPARSVMFLFLAAEERGLLGSSYHAAAPTVPLAAIRGVINLDAGAPPAPPVSWRIAAGQGSQSLTALAAEIANDYGWQLAVGEATPNSDHWPFAARGVPALFLIPGTDWEGTTADQAARLRARFERYHQPGDHWHADFPFAGLARYANFALAIGRAAAGPNFRR